MTTLAIDGGAPVRTGPWPAWPPAADEAQRTALLGVLDSGKWGATAGPVCDEFAAAFAARHDCAHGVMVTNGTLALFVALKALGVEPGDEVIVPAYTFVACATSVLLLGAVPVIADVAADHLHLDAAGVEAALSPRTKAIMPVHLAGSPAPMTELLDIAAKHGLGVVEDCAQAHGATYRGTPVGGIGDVGTFSFQSSKAMTAGEGGVMTTRDEALASALWSLCNLGRERGGAWYGHYTLGWNLRVTEFQAALLMPWLDRLDSEIARRNSFVDALEPLLGDGPVRVAPQPEGTTMDSRHLLLLQVDPARGPLDRDWIQRAMAAEGVELESGYPPLGTIPALQGAVRTLPCPGAEAAARNVFWLRQPQLMADDDGPDQVAQAAAKVFADARTRVS